MPHDHTPDPNNPEFRRDPHARLRRARQECPILLHPGAPRCVSVLSYDAVREVLRDWQTFSNEISPQETSQEFGAIIADPPDHDRIRGLLERAFRPRMIRQLEPRLREVADALLDEALDARDVDLVQALAYPLPVIAIAEILGVPSEDHPRFKAWSDEAFSTLGLGLFGDVDDALAERHRILIREMRDYFEPLVRARRSDPRDDLLTGMVRAEHEGTSFGLDELIRALLLLLVAGNETTTSLIGNAVLDFHANPLEEARLRAQPELVPSAVEEVLRYSSPILYDPRRATRDVELQDTQILKGDVVLAWFAAANRDEKVFEDPQRFDIGRGRSPHLSFGLGIHYCLGASLARLEMKIALEALMTRTRSFARRGSDPLPMHPSPVFGAVTALPVRLEPS